MADITVKLPKSNKKNISIQRSCQDIIKSKQIREKCTFHVLAFLTLFWFLFDSTSERAVYYQNSFLFCRLFYFFLVYTEIENADKWKSISTYRWETCHVNECLDERLDIGMIAIH